MLPLAADAISERPTPSQARRRPRLIFPLWASARPPSAASIGQTARLGRASRTPGGVQTQAAAPRAQEASCSLSHQGAGLRLGPRGRGGVLRPGIWLRSLEIQCNQPLVPQLSWYRDARSCLSPSSARDRTLMVRLGCTGLPKGLWVGVNGKYREIGVRHG